MSRKPASARVPKAPDYAELRGRAEQLLPVLRDLKRNPWKFFWKE